ncbi:MAG: stage III sporulation protein AA [Clostridia bacterium]|nr:stage III sporulation protein AA [Clostridia bacterium]
MQRALQGIRELLPKELCCLLERQNSLERADEIRIRAGKPMMAVRGKHDWFIDVNGEWSRSPIAAFIMDAKMVEETFSALCRHSVYAYEAQIGNGFITLQGGHRVGLSGPAVMEQDGRLNIGRCSGLCIRIARQIKGCAQHILPWLMEKNRLCSTMIVSPPMMGKTTMLRDIVRAVSNGESGTEGMRVCLIDERSEIAACYAGEPQMDIGLRTDVLDGWPKREGMLRALRALGPQVIALDELGDERDVKTAMEAANMGVALLATAHAASAEQLMQRPSFKQIAENQTFERFVQLGGTPGNVQSIIDKNGRIIWQRDLK